MKIIEEPDIRRITDLREIKIKNLHVQYIPNHTPIELWNYDMSIANSPHVELLQLIKDFGFDWPKIFQSRYVKERQLRCKQGMEKWTNDYISKRVRRRWDIYLSLKQGFNEKLYKDQPVRVLKEPFWTTRFGYKKDWLKGFEIWDGAGRTSAAYVLGWPTIKGYYYEDTKPGSNDKGKFGEKLAKIKGVWEGVL